MTPPEKLLRVFAATVCLLALGCSSTLKPPVVGERGPQVPDSKEESEYQATLDRYTSRAEIYDLMDTRLFTAATYQSWPFRDARVHRLGIFQVHPPVLVERNLSLERADFESFHEFFLGVHVNYSRYDDFDRKDSIWRIVIATREGETTPLAVRRVGRSDLNLRAMYPYLDEFWVAYWVRFPRKTAFGTDVIPPGTNRFTLRIASTLGRADFSFPAQ
jgi:hypothetical protein